MESLEGKMSGKLCVWTNLTIRNLSALAHANNTDWSTNHPPWETNDGDDFQDVRYDILGHKEE